MGERKATSNTIIDQLNAIARGVKWEETEGLVVKARPFVGKGSIHEYDLCPNAHPLAMGLPRMVESAS